MWFYGQQDQKMVYTRHTESQPLCSLFMIIHFKARAFTNEYNFELQTMQKPVNPVSNVCNLIYTERI